MTFRLRSFELEFFGAFGLVTLSGCLWFLAVTPFDLSWLAWFAAVPMLFAVDRARSFGQALFLGWWAGVVETGGGFYWLIDVMQRFADFPWWAAAGVFALFCATRAIIFLLFTAAVCGIRRRRRVPMTLLAPVAMVSSELLVPQLFPCGQWISQAWHPLVIQIAELTGPLGVTALLMLVNGALYDAAIDRRAARRPALAAAALVAAVLVFGAVRMHQVDAIIAQAPRLQVGLVQPNFAYTVDGQLTREEAVRQLTALQSQSRRLQQAGAQLVVWSEGAYPVTLPRIFGADFDPDYEGAIRRGFDVPLVIGADMFDPAHQDAFNSAILLDAAGRVSGIYDKVRLLAFGEYIPGIETFPWLRNFLPEGSGRFTAGSGPGLLTLQGPGVPPGVATPGVAMPGVATPGPGVSSGPAVPGAAARVWRLGPVICYEDILQGFLRGVGRLHPDLLVNLTSDSWFGAGTEPWEHLALAVFGSVELRVSMVRAVNSGVSALIDPNGRLLRTTYADDPYRQPRAADGIVVSAPGLSGGHTPFVAVGNLFAYLCIAATLALMGLAARHRTKSP
jgi:apolipoprotein N-acyltransferase